MAGSRNGLPVIFLPQNRNDCSILNSMRLFETTGNSLPFEKHSKNGGFTDRNGYESERKVKQT